MKDRVIDFIMAALREHLIEGGNNKNKPNYYGHNFNSSFRQLEIDIRDGVYMALVLFLEFGKYDPNNLFRFNELNDWLERLKTVDIDPSSTTFDNWNLKWNLYYQLKRITTQQ